MTEGNTKADLPAVPPDAVGDPCPGCRSVPAFHVIYKQYFDFVWASARHLGAARDAIDDVVQDAFVVIHARLGTLQNPDALRSWVYGVVRRTVSDHRRSRRARDAAGDRFRAEHRTIGSALPSPLEVAERNSDLELIERVLAELDEPKREVFVMVEALGMTMPEVVSALDIPLNTAYSRLRLARKQFDEALARLEAPDGENR